MSFDATNKPWFQPPSWVFGPVWSFLYITMTASIIVAWQERDSVPKTAFALFAAQLLLNLIWSSFFSQSNYLASMLIIIGMVAFSIGYVVVIYPYAPLASWLLIPYICWITFAGIINVWYYLEG
jgi:translocator protein